MTPPTHQLWNMFRTNGKRGTTHRSKPGNVRYLIGGVMTPPYILITSNYNLSYFQRYKKSRRGRGGSHAMA